jgi:transcription initiation factor TFIIA large subunit
MHVAQCPWDPAPAPQTPTLPSNVKSDPSLSSVPSQQPRNVGAPGDQHIKQEIKYEGGMQAYPQASAYGGSADPSAAQARTNQLLQQRFGNQAQASIHATGLQPQQQQRPPQMQGRPTHIQLPGPGQHLPGSGQQRPPQPPPPQQQQQQQYPQPHSSLSAAQTDGADDGLNEWTAILAERRAQTVQDRMAADGMLRAHLDQSAARMDSGLMVPLSEIPSSKASKRQTPSIDAFAVPGPSWPLTTHIPQMDGGDDDEDDKGAVKAKIEADEDAINSDLDDSDDDFENPDVEEQDGPLGETILCTYDKVQRVKNKVSLLFLFPCVSVRRLLT